MPVQLPLETMTTQEKMDLAEVLWDDIARSPNEIKSPAWHADVLEDIQRRVESGEAQFIELKDLKANVMRRVS